MDKHLRKLAQSNRWQTLYSRAKEISGLHLFDNICDFSKIQILFLKWLEAYHSMYVDLALGEDYIHEDVINDPLRAEAYLFLKAKERKNKKNKKERDKTKRPNLTGIPSVIFKARK